MIPRLLVMSGAVLALPALAATTPAEQSDVETVTVYALRPTPVARVAAAVTVIDQAVIERSLANDIKQLVRYEPGLVVRQDPFRFGLDSISVRGLGGNRVRVEVDGIPAASGFAVGAYADTGRSVVDMAFVDRVEIMRGPASSLYGSDAIGGIVAIRTLRPATLLEATSNPVVARVAAGYQSEDQGWRASAIVAGTAGPGALLLGYVRREGREAQSAATIRPNPRRYQSDSALLKYVIDAFSGGPLGITAEGGRVRQDTAVDAFIGTAPRFVYTTALHGEDQSERYRFSVAQSLDQAGVFGNVQWRLYWQATDTQQDSFETRSAAPPRTPPLQIERRFNFEERTAGLELSAVRSWQGAGVRHELVSGVEAVRRRIGEGRDGSQTNLLTGVPTNSILGEVMPVRDLPITNVTELGVFAQDEIALGDSRWTLIPALRFDYYALQPQVDAIYLEDNPAASPVSLRDASLTPKLGVTYRFSAAVSAFFQYARGFRAAPPGDVNFGFQVPLLNYAALPNPDLQPETSDGYELGLRWRGPWLELHGSVYYNDYRDFIESKINLGVDPVSGVTQFQSRNVETARIWGGEAGLAVRADPNAERLAGWSGRFSASWARGRDLSRAQPLNSVGPASAVTALRFDAPSGQWGGELIATVVAAQRDIDRTRVDLQGTAGYLTLDWRFNVRLGSALLLDGGVFNIANRAYIEWEDIRGRAANDPLVPYYTRPGRSYALNVRREF